MTTVYRTPEKTPYYLAIHNHVVRAGNVIEGIT